MARFLKTGTKKRFRAFTSAVFVLHLVFIISCTTNQESPESKTINVKAVPVKEKTIPDTINGFGVLSFRTKIDITSGQEGRISRIYYREGSRTAAGSLAVLMDNPQIELAVRRAEDGFSQAGAALSLAKARLTEGEYMAEAELLGIAKTEAELAEGLRALEEERRRQGDTEKLYAAGGLSDEAIRESRFSLESAEEKFRLMERELEIRRVGLRDRDLAALGLIPAGGFPSAEAKTAALVRLSTLTLRAETEAAEAQLEAAGRELESARFAFSELSVRSPAPGIVGARYAEEGERVERGAKLLTLIDTETLYAVFNLRESDALRLQKGMIANIAVDGTGLSYRGEVDLVSPQADSQSFTFSVRVVLPSADNLKPGMFARISVNAGTDKKCLVLPEKALLNKKNDEGTVFVIQNGKVSQRRIMLGAALNGEEREVLSGLSSGEVIVLDPGTSLKEGTHVNPQ